MPLLEKSPSDRASLSPKATGTVSLRHPPRAIPFTIRIYVEPYHKCTIEAGTERDVTAMVDSKKAALIPQSL